MEKREWIIWSLLGLLIVSTIYLWTNMPIEDRVTQTSQKTGYVDVVQVFDSFEMKNELEKKLEVELYDEQVILDSLMFQLQKMSSELEKMKDPNMEEVQRFQTLQSYYLQEKQVFENYSQELTSKYDSQILAQLSQYIKDYGFNNGYDYVFGATGDGNILYGADPMDITDEIIEFVNLSYQGKN